MEAVAQSGVYFFRSRSDEDTYAELYKAGGEGLTYDDESGWASNFSMWHELEAGQTYYCAVKFYDESVTGTIPVKVYRSPLKAVSNATATVMEELTGDWQTDEDAGTDYFVYQYDAQTSYTVTFTDNSTKTVTGSEFEHDGEYYAIAIADDQLPDNVWQAGKTHKGTLWLADLSCDVSVTVVDMPVKSITVDPVTLLKESSGDTALWQNPATNAEEEYFHYYWDQSINGTITLTDNSTIPLESGWIEYGDFAGSVGIFDQQGKTEVWSAGNTYSTKVRVGGAEVSVPVTILESPVKKVEVQPITMHGDLGAEWYGEDEGPAYFLYRWYDEMVVTVTFRDNTTYTTEPGQSYIEYGGDEYSIDFSQNQSADNQWQPEHTYTEQITVMGVTAPVTVTIGPNVIKSMTASDVSMIEGTGGYRTQEWNDATGEYDSYYHYEWCNELEGTLTLADGTELSGSLSDFAYLGEDFSYSYGDTQSEQTPWRGGNTYTCEVRLGTHTARVKVTITASPLQSISVQPVIMAENSEGIYEWWDHVQYFLTFGGGVTTRGDGSGFVYNGQTYYPDSEDDQEDEPWTAGNTYDGTLIPMGIQASVDIYIGKEVTSGDYSYVVYQNKAYITNSNTGKASLTLPTTLDGYDVAGIVYLGDDLLTAQQIVIPDCVTHLDPRALWHAEGATAAVTKLTVGAGIQYFNTNMLRGAKVEEVTVSTDNPYYCSVDGVVYDRAKTRLIVYPQAKTDSHEIPDTVKDIEVLVEDHVSIPGLEVTFGTGIKDYVMMDGVAYSADMTKVVFCNASTSGAYTTPDTVTQLGEGAFANSGFTSITVSDRVTQLPELAFSGSRALTSVKLPEGLQRIPYAAFARCTALRTVRLPEDVTYIGYGAFTNAGLTSIVLPAGVDYVDVYAFTGCLLEDVYYGGTEETWAAMEVEYGNDSLRDAALHFGTVLPGDMDGDGDKDTDDAVYLLLHVMFGAGDYPVIADTDIDGDGDMDTDDAVYLLLNVMFGAEDYPL